MAVTAHRGWAVFFLGDAGTGIRDQDGRESGHLSLNRRNGDSSTSGIGLYGGGQVAGMVRHSGLPRHFGVTLPGIVRIDSPWGGYILNLQF